MNLLKRKAVLAAITISMIGILFYGFSTLKPKQRTRVIIGLVCPVCYFLVL